MTPRRWVRVLLAAAAVFAFFLIYSLFVAGMTGWSFLDPGPARLRESAGGLVISATLGLIAIGGARLILRWRLLSPWLLLALPIPILFGIDAIGLW